MTESDTPFTDEHEVEIDGSLGGVTPMVNSDYVRELERKYNDEIQRNQKLANMIDYYQSMILKLTEAGPEIEVR